MADTLSALRINGLLALDDMNLDLHSDAPELRDQLEELTATLLSDRRLMCLEIPISSGLILAVRHE